MTPTAAGKAATILHIGAGRTATPAVLSVWEAGLADLRDHVVADGTHLAELTAVELIRQTSKFVTLAEFRSAYLARLPRPPGPNRSDLLELEPAPGDRVASPETAARWLHEIRTQLAAMAERDRDMLGERSSHRSLPDKSRLRSCVAPDCGRLTSFRDGLCLVHRPDHEKRPQPEPEMEGQP